MEEENFDVYPILHKGRIYNIVTAMDMTFREVRAMIDWLDARGAFPSGNVEGGEAAEREPEGPYVCAVEGSVFHVDVQGYEIVVYRRRAAE